MIHWTGTANHRMWGFPREYRPSNINIIEFSFQKKSNLFVICNVQISLFLFVIIISYMMCWSIVLKKMNCFLFYHSYIHCGCTTIQNNVKSAMYNYLCMLNKPMNKNLAINNNNNYY